MVPYLSARAPWFSFIAHIRDSEDIDRIGVGSFLRRYSRDEEDVRAKVRTLDPVVAAGINFLGSSATGEVVCVCRFPEQMMSADGRRWVLEAVQLAAKRGSKVIGLGGLTAPATGGGLTLRDQLPRGVTLTNGNALTAVIVRDNVVEAARILGRGRDARVAIIGCTGSVGGAATQLIASAGFALTLIGRTRSRVEKTFSMLHARYSGTIEDAADADVVVILTSDETARFRPWHAKPGAIVIDCAQPVNVPAGNYVAFAGHGVSVVEGGLVDIPGYASTSEFTGVRRSAFACLAETYLFSCSGIREHSLGRPTVEHALRLERVARGRGVTALPIAPRVHAQAAMEVCTT
jgi:fatty aldehyde-generating acyl-ACP reductase